MGLSVMDAPEGGSAEMVTEQIAQALEDVFAVRVTVRQQAWIPDGAYDRQRGQYNAPLVLRSVLEGAASEPPKLLAVTGGDLFIPMLSFVYGQAQLGGRAAVVSIARLRQEYYGLPANAALLAGRARKEAVHETGHLFGLVHCEAPDCAMRLSTNIRQLDMKGDRLCSGCAAMLMERVI